MIGVGEELDVSADDSPFFESNMPTMRSGSSSSDGLPHAVGLSWEGSVESNEVRPPRHRLLRLPVSC